MSGYLGDTLKSVALDRDGAYYDAKVYGFYEQPDIFSMVSDFSALPENKGKNVNIVKDLPPSMSIKPAPVQEGQTPPPSNTTQAEVIMAVEQYMYWLMSTDRMEKLWERGKMVLKTKFAKWLIERSRNARSILCNTAFDMGTAADYSTGSARTSVIDVPSANHFRRAEISLLSGITGSEERGAEMFSSMKASNRNNSSVEVEAAFYVLCHPHTVHDLRNLAGFKTRAEYAHVSGPHVKYERGAMEAFRFWTTKFATPYLAGGAAVGTENLRHTSANVDVYTFKIFGKDATKVLGPHGKALARIIRHGLGSGGVSDPGNQRSTAAVKFDFAAAIIYQERMRRLEAACTLNPAA